MPTESWRSVRLGEIASIKHGWPFKSEHFSEELTGRPIVVAIGNLEYTGGFRFASTTVREYRGDYPPEYELVPGDIVVVMTCQTPGGEILGIPARVPDDGRVYLHNQRIGKVVITRPDLVDADFLYWVFLWKELNQELVASSSGTKIVHTAPSRIEAFRFDLPPLDEQQAIARLLWALERKQELNRSMNRTLKAMGMALFRSWFVDFDPVHARADGHAPKLPTSIADLFPESFEDSAVGKVPKGWRQDRLGDHLLNFDSKRVPVSNAERAKRRGVYPYHGAAGVMDYVDGYLFDGIYVLVGEDGSVIRNSGMAVVQYVWGKFWVNNHAHVLQGKDAVSTEQLYMYFQFEPVAPYVTGAVQPKLSQGRMNAMPFLFAGEHVCRAFADVVSPWFTKWRSNLSTNNTLAALRDILLPQLLSGAIRLKQADKFVEAAS